MFVQLEDLVHELQERLQRSGSHSSDSGVLGAHDTDVNSLLAERCVWAIKFGFANFVC